MRRRAGGLNLRFESGFNLREEKTSGNQRGARFMSAGLKTAGICAFREAPIQTERSH